MHSSGSSSNAYQSQSSGSSAQSVPQPQFPAHGTGGVYDNVTATSPMSFTGSDSSVPEPMFDMEPSYAAVNGQNSFQLGMQPEETWGPLNALANPNYWKDMMMPGYVVLLLSRARA